jgi:hypothetical protein
MPLVRSQAITVSVPGTVTGGIGLEVRQVDDGELRDEGLELVLVRADQQVADEERMPGELGHHPRRQRVVFVGAADQVLHIERLALGMGEHIGLEHHEVLRRHSRLLSHQIVASVLASRTTCLSLGERPVCWPVSARRAPWAVRIASPLDSASS